MGFYGNITNTSKTQFQFDRIYPNRATMENKRGVDNIYAGRFVLIEYDKNTEVEGFNRAWGKSEGGKLVFYSSNTFENVTRYNKNNTEKGYIVFTSDKDLQPNEQLVYKNCKFYVCESILDANDSTPAEWRELVKSENPYTMNYTIDTEAYGQGRGYDSTVWQKTYVDGRDKYVQIAELNSVVPTFDISADAPTMTPIVPHFDVNSTNVYYKLHMQPQWGFRVAAANENVSDEKVTWTTTTYDPKTDKTTTTNDNNVNGAIYYNKEAFDKQLNKKSIHKKDEDTLNTIKIVPTGESGNQYNLHNKTGAVAPAKDIQELTINLPAIGNMMSDAWDIIHGPNRDNARTDDNSSLQGRLDSFKEIEVNQIPVKRAEDGTLIGSMINSAIAYNNWEDKPNEILDDDGITPAFARDDAWIETVIDTSNLVGGVKDGDDVDQSANSGISIHHTFHATENSTSTLDKNTGEVTQSETYKENYIPVSNNTTEKDDTIRLYTPYVDAKGHVVGNNIETITLPFGFKTIKTNGRGDDVDPDTNKSKINTNNDVITTDIIADNTQDDLIIYSGNKWIRIDTDTQNDSITITHDVHQQTSSDSEKTLSNEVSENVTFNVPTYSFDDAGHYVSHDTKTLTMPFGYGKILGDNNTSTAATATFDTVTFASDNWLTATVSKDKVTYSHDYPEDKEDTKSRLDMNDNENSEDEKNKIVLETLAHDDKGHIINVNQHTVTLPYGFKNITPATQSTAVDNPSVNETKISADNTQDDLVIASSNKWIRMSAGESNGTDTFYIGHEVHEITESSHTADWTTKEDDTSIPVVSCDYDEAGHFIKHHTETYKLPFGYGKIKGDSGSTAATATYDELSFVTADKWLSTSVDKDSVSFSHDFTAVDDTETSADKNASGGTGINKGIGDTLKLYTPIVDEKGHIVGKNIETVTLPYGYKVFNGDEGTSSADNAQDTMSVNGDTWIKTIINNDKISINHLAANSVVAVNKNNNEPKFGDVFELEDYCFDSNGHYSVSGKHTVKIPLLSLEEPNNSSDNVLVGLTLSAKDGKFTKVRDNIGNLKITGFTALTEADSLALDANHTLNAALGRLQYRIEKEETVRENAINGLDVSDAEVDGQYVSEVSETDGKISVKRKSIPVYTLTTGTANGTVKFNDTDVSVKGLGSAAYTNADSYLQLNTKYKESTIEELLDLIISLNGKITELENRINKLESPVEEEETPTE